jgi:site-specific DNA-methyltransferase (adenine-specific)
MMGEEWDSFKPEDKEVEEVEGRAELLAFQNFLVSVFTEVYRVLKPGAFGLVWALPRTSHHTGMALERSGFEIRDRLVHLFSQGYKKGLDIKKALLAQGLTEEADKWSGYHTGVKPAIEDWWLIRKPISGKIIENLLRYGTGVLNIDASRVYTDWDEADRPESWKRSGFTSKPEADKVAAPPGQGINCHPLGRWPADVVFSHNSSCKRVGTQLLKGDQRGDPGGKRPGGFYATGADVGDGKPNSRVYGNEGVPIYECEPGCPVRILNEQENGASRFFQTFDPDYDEAFQYIAKPSTKEKSADLDEGLVNEHKTVKSLKLMTYLVRLITPQGGKVLDPFAGSGTTLVAAAELGFGFLGIERDPKTWPVLKNRVANALQRIEDARDRDEAANLVFKLESE